MSDATGPNCACGAMPKLVFACSWAADLGETADRAARKLAQEGVGRMYCLAGVGGHIEDMLLNVQAAAKILAIDGCPKDCARHTLANAGFTDIAHLRLTDMGFEKGASPVTDERIAQVVASARPLLAGQP